MQAETTQKSLYEKLYMNDEFECLERPVSGVSLAYNS